MTTRLLKIMLVGTICGAVLCILPHEGLCKLSGEVDLQYINTDAKDNSGQHLSTNALTQHYSLLYQTQGKLFEGRFGRYDFAAGYEWNTFDTTLKSNIAGQGSDNFSSSRGHILYKGELIIDPKEVPFSFKAYSRDMNRNQFQGYLSTGINGSGGIYLPTTISNGTHIESGATLVMGVKNGMTNGYNEVLRHFPMLLLDFRDFINKDRSSQFPVDNRLTRLAFVSLNKKDNWFHYRVTTYNDYVTPSSNYRETQIQLGTIDQHLERRWIDFTNWLSVSADGQLTKRTNDRSSLMSNSPSYDEFDLNLYAVARRSSWEARSFNNFNRLREEGGIVTYRTNVPLYVSGELSADTTWNTRFSYNENHTSAGDSFSTLAGSYRIDAFRRAPFTLSQQFSIEAVKAPATNLTALAGALETSSTGRFSQLWSLAGQYSIKYYDYSDTNNSLLDQSIKGTVRYAPSTSLRFSLDEIVRLTSGTSESISSNIPGIIVGTPQYNNTFGRSLQADSFFQSTTAFGVTWNPLPRFNVTVGASEDILSSSDSKKNSSRTEVNNTLEYSAENLHASSHNSYSTVHDAQGGQGSEKLFSSTNRLSYTFSRSMDTSLVVTYLDTTNSSISSSASQSLHVEHLLHYYFYKTNGVTRRLFEITESAEYVDDISLSTSTTTLGLTCSYYPLKQLSLSAGTRHEFTNGDYNLSLYGGTGLSFRLFQATLDYYYGKRKSDGLIEKRVTANVRKSF